MLFAVFGILLIVGILGLFGVVALVALGSKQEMDALERGIAAGDASGLAEFSPGSLAWLSKDVVGGAYYYRPMGGARTSKLAVSVPAYEGSATLLALSAESTPRRGEGRIDMVARGPRVALFLQNSVWHVHVDGQPFGAVDPATGRLDDYQRGNVGFYRRTSQGVVVHVRGADVAWIDSDAKLHRRRPDSLRPLLRLASPSPDPQAALWALAIVGVELTSALMVWGGGAMAGVP